MASFTPGSFKKAISQEKGDKNNISESSDQNKRFADFKESQTVAVEEVRMAIDKDLGYFEKIIAKSQLESALGKLDIDEHSSKADVMKIVNMIVEKLFPHLEANSQVSINECLTKTVSLFDNYKKVSKSPQNYQPLMSTM